MDSAGRNRTDQIPEKSSFDPAFIIGAFGSHVVPCECVRKVAFLGVRLLYGGGASIHIFIIVFRTNDVLRFVTSHQPAGSTVPDPVTRP